MSEKLSENLLETRKAQKLSRREVSEKAGISERTLQRYENGERTPNMDTLNRLAKALGKTISHFVSHDDYVSAYHDQGIFNRDMPPYEEIITTGTADDDADLKEAITESLNALNRDGLEKVSTYVSDLAMAPPYHYRALRTTQEIWHKDSEKAQNRKVSKEHEN